MFKLNFKNNWNSILESEFKKDYFKTIENEYQESKQLISKLKIQILQ